jgi:uncharacterized protein
MRAWELNIYFAIGLLLASLIATPLYADNSSAYEYWKQGNYQAALKILRPDAQKGDIWSQKLLGRMYLKGLGVQQDFNEAAKWYTKAADQGDVRSQFFLASSYENGVRGFAKNPAQAVKWYLKIAAQNQFADTLPGDEKVKTFALRRLGFHYYEGEGVAQDYQQAAKWTTVAALQGDANAQSTLGLMYKDGLGVKRNPAAAQKWLQMSEKGVSEKRRSMIHDILGELNVKGFLDARARWREKFPAFMKPFGIVLGKRFPAELGYKNRTFLYKNYDENKRKYGYVKPASPFPEGAQRTDFRARYSVFASKETDTVYKVSASVQFDSEDQCRQALTAFYRSGPAQNTAAKIVSDWHRVSDYHSDFYGADLFVSDFGQDTPTTKKDAPLKLVSVAHLSGARLVLSCKTDNTADIVFVHFPSVEMAIAQNVETTPEWAAYYDRQKSDIKRPGYMAPFGIALGQPLSEMAKRSNDYDDERFSLYTVTPSRPHNLFTDYTVRTSPMTGSVISVRAEGQFKNKSNCNRVMFGSVTGFMKKYGPYPYKGVKNAVNLAPNSPLLSGFYLTPEGIDEGSPRIQLNGEADNSKGQFLVYATLGCSQENGVWMGGIEYNHPLTEIIARMEQSALTITQQE